MVIACMVNTSCQNKEEEVKKETKENTIEKLSERPNILWLVTEDMGAYIPPFGDSTVVTPHLTKLAEEGVIYPNLYSTSGVCAPSRAAIATGMYPSSIGANHMRTNSYTKERGFRLTKRFRLQKLK
ncbi:sulfatase-like hydrolase/transferase [Jejuia pallidilutea]|nr:sulfatase-like hydrolase/transferase [Jejuia pallidilutea]